jgi:hypothetical protein
VTRDFLSEIENDLLDDVPLARILRKAIVMSGHVDSPVLRAWAEQELNGYTDDYSDPPSYRTRGAPICADATVGNATVTRQTISPVMLPEFARDVLDSEVTFRQGVGELEATLEGDGEFLKLGIPNFHVVAQAMDAASDNRFQQIHEMYWYVSKTVIVAILDHTRTALAQIVAELRRTTGPSDVLPSSAATDRAVSVAVFGEGATATVTVTDASGAGAATQTVVGDTDGSVSPHVATTTGDGQTVAGAATNVSQDRQAGLRARVSAWSGLAKAVGVVGSIASIVGVALYFWPDT